MPIVPGRKIWNSGKAINTNIFNFIIMKKTLLMIVATMFVALAVNAQTKHIAQPVTLNGEKAMLSTSYSQSAQGINTIAKASKVAHAEDGIAGDYILDFQNWAGDFTGSMTFTIEEAEGTIVLDQYENSPEFTYNVILRDFTLAGAAVKAFYDAEQGTIEIPVQDLGDAKTVFGYTGDQEIGDVVFSAVVCVDGTPKTYGYGMVILVNEDGSLSIDKGDFSEEIAAGEMPEGAYISGWYHYLTGVSGAWSFGFEIAVFAPNATLSYSTTSTYLGGTGNGWSDVSKRVYVENFENELLVHGFLGLALASIMYDDEGNCMLPFGQEMDDNDYSDDNFAYGRMRLVGCLLDGNSIYRNYDKESLNGFWKDGLFEFYKTEYKEAWDDENGNHHEAGNYYVDDDDNYLRYFCVATAAGEDGAYGMGWACNLKLELDPDNVDGIANATVATEKNNSVVYNLMGQPVSKNFKGIVIENGKKVVRK